MSCLIKDVEGAGVVFTVAVDPSPSSGSVTFAVEATDQDEADLLSPC